MRYLIIIICHQIATTCLNIAAWRRGTTVNTGEVLTKRQQTLDGYGFNLIGALFSGGSIVLWDPEYADKNSVAFKEIEKILCIYLKVFAGINGLKTKLCRMAQLSEAETSIGSYTNVYIQLLTDLSAPDKNQLSDRDEARKYLMESLAWFSNIGMAQYYIGVKSENTFSPDEAFMYGTSPDNTIMAWPLKPTDCSLIYQMDYRLVDNPSDEMTTPDQCENSYGPIANDKTNGNGQYEFRVRARLPASPTFNYTSEWITKRTTNDAKPIIVSGKIRTLSNIPYPFIPEMTDLMSTSGSLVSSKICDSVQTIAFTQGIVPITCRVLSIDQASTSDETEATLQMDLVNHFNTSDLNDELKAAIMTISLMSPNDTNKLNFFLSDDTLVDDFYGKTLNFGFTSETSQNVSWPEYPTDCGYKYQLEYRMYMNTTIMKEDVECENSHNVMNLRPETEYQYKLIANKNQNAIRLPWSKFIKTKSVTTCGVGCILAATICTVIGVSGLAFLAMFLINRRNNEKIARATKLMLSDISKHFSSSTLRDSFNENQTGQRNLRDINLPQRPTTPKMTRKLKELIHRVS